MPSATAKKPAAIPAAEPALELPGVHYEPLFRYEVRLALSPRHRLAAKSAIEPADLADEVLICYPVERARLDVFRHFLEPAGIEPASVRTAITIGT